MISRFIVLLSVIAAATTHAQMPSAAIETSISAIEPRVIEWRRDLHRHPELSNREFRTAEKMAAHLRELGVDSVQTGIAGTGVVGTLRGGLPGPVVALRADMDGLPVREQTGLPFASTATGEYNGAEVPVMHACGHDAHMAMLMGAASVLAEHRDQLRGTVRFVFQPAEEGAPAGEKGGASLMVEEGLLAGDDAPEAIMGLHVWPLEHGSLRYRSGPIMAAADTLEITIVGEQTHGSSPWLGVDPIYVSSQVINALQGIPSRHVDVTRGPAVITIGSINGGVRGNIIPDSVVMQGTIRTFDAGEREEIHARIRSTVTKIAELNGATAEVVIGDPTPVTTNDPELLRAMAPILARAVGTDEFREMRYVTGAEDFSYYQQQIPGLFMMVGINDPGVPDYSGPANHSPLFTVNETALLTGVRALVAFAMGYAEATDR